jgi:hypothetical protein
MLRRVQRLDAQGRFWAVPQEWCCCNWGAAVGSRGRGPSGEVPEFPCEDCPVEGHDLMAGSEHRCKRHRREKSKRERGRDE